MQVDARCIEAIYTRYNSGLINPPFLRATMKHGRSEHHGENNNFHGAIFTFLRESFHYPIRHFFVTKFVTHITKLVTHVRKFVTRITKFVTNFFCVDRKNIKEKVEICSLTVKIVRLELTVECCGNEKKRGSNARLLPQNEEGL